MSKQKRIEEVIKDLCEAPTGCVKDDFTVGTLKESHTDLFIRTVAGHLVSLNYRKQSEGKWEIVKGSNGKEKMVCTNCRHQQDLASTFTYCPNCGASMHGAKMKGV